MRLIKGTVFAGLFAFAGFALMGCTDAQMTASVAKGQLYCAKATTDGPLVVALADMSGAPVIATNATADMVAAECNVINAIPVSPPAAPAAAPVVTIPPVASSANTLTPAPDVPAAAK